VKKTSRQVKAKPTKAPSKSYSQAARQSRSPPTPAEQSRTASTKRYCRALRTAARASGNMVGATSIPKGLSPLPPLAPVLQTRKSPHLVHRRQQRKQRGVFLAGAAKCCHAQVERIVPIGLAITEPAVVYSDLQRLPMNGLQPRNPCPGRLGIYDWQSHKQSWANRELCVIR
jgi:hypothetical protein